MRQDDPHYDADPPRDSAAHDWPLPLPSRRAFPHGRVVCPSCQAHNDARNPVCLVCGVLLPDNLPRLDTRSIGRHLHPED